MNKVSAYIIMVLLGTVFMGAIITGVYALIKKLKGERTNKKIILRIFVITFIFYAIIGCIALFSNTTTTMQASNNPATTTQVVNPIIQFLPLIIIIGIVWFIIKVNRNKFRATGSQITGNLIHNLGNRGERLIEENLHGDKIIVKLKGSFGEGLVITDKRLYVLKWGFMAGNFLGGRCIDFGYSNIVGLEIKKGWGTGTFEVLTPATQNAQKSYWGTGNNSAIRSDNVVTFQSNKFGLFQEAVKIGRGQLQNLNLQSIHNSQSIPVTSNYSDLEKLAELKGKGIITKEEFEAKKKKILDL